VSSEPLGLDAARDLIRLFETSGPPPDARDDVDTASLRRRLPHLRDVEIESLEIAGPHGPVPVRRYDGPEPNGVGLVWVHGGAFLAGDLDMPESNWVGLELASRGYAVLAVDYRKALRGVHHPVPLDDVATAWAAAPATWGDAVTSIHLGGASAGAFLAAATALRSAVEGGRRPDSLTLIYPLLHRHLPPARPAAAAAAATLPEALRFRPGFVLGLNDNYLGPADPLAHPIAFPADGRLESLPRTLVISAQADDLRASGEAFAAALEAAGVPFKLGAEPGTTHGYLDRPDEPGAKATLDRIARWIAPS
jgi:acetyl esterase/lipase